MPEENNIFGYILNSLDRQAKVTTTQGITQKLLSVGVVVLIGWNVHLTRKLNRLERTVEKEKKDRRTRE